MDTVTGYIDGTISFCPYCGADLIQKVLFMKQNATIAEKHFMS